MNNSIDNPRKRSVSFKLTFLFLFFSVFIIVVSSSIYFYTGYQLLQENILEEIESSSNLRVTVINEIFKKYSENTDLFASRYQMRVSFKSYLENKDPKDKATIERIISEAMASSKSIKTITLVDSNGKGVVSSHGGREERDYSSRNFFINGKNRTFIDGLLPDPHGGSSLFVSSPLFLEGSFLGFVLISFSPDEIVKFFDDFSSIDHKSEVYLVNNEGYFLTPSKHFGRDAILTKKVNTTNFNDCLLHRDEFFDVDVEHHAYYSVENYIGEKVIGTHSYISEADICLLIEFNRNDIYISPIKKLFSEFIIIFFVSIFLVFLVSIFFSKKISKPFDVLEEGVQRIKKGNFKQKIDLKTDDDFESLAEVLNDAMEVFEKSDNQRKELERAKTEFLSITSHELRSPMTPMRAQLQMLLKQYFGSLNKKQKEAVEIVLRNTERLDKIIADFLEISRIEAARLKFNFVKTNLNEHIHLLLDEMKGFLPEKKIAIDFVPSRLPIIETDPDRIMQVLRNLLNNAKKFSPENSKIIVRAQKEGDFILFSVKDSGVGISKEGQTRLFEPFYQIDNMYQHKSGGTGLGLAISKGIIESQGGRIWIKSEAKKGTTFYFTIPLKPVKEIKPIKLLFSEQGILEKEVKEVFKEVLGPLGENEFEEFNRDQNIDKENLFKYIKSLYSKGVIDIDRKILFMEKVSSVFGVKYRHSSMNKNIKRWVDKF